MLREIRLGDNMLLTSAYEHINSNMYVLLAEKEALILDPHKDEELTGLLVSKGIKKVTILLTHEHHDHTTGLYWYQDLFESVLICQRKAADYISRKQYLRPTLIAFILGEKDRLEGSHIYEEFKKTFVPRQYYADISYSDRCSLKWQDHQFDLYHVPGHSPGGSLIVLDGRIAFTGDSLMKDLPIIIRFPGSSKEEYLRVSMPLMSRILTPDMMVLPGHGNPFFLRDIIINNHIYVQFR